MRFVLLLLAAPAWAASQPSCPGPACYSPSNGALNATDFSLWLLKASLSFASLAVAPGSYSLAAPASGPHLRLPPLQDVSLHMEGVTLVCSDRYAPGVYTSGWVRSAISGLALRWASPPSNTAVVTAVLNATAVEVAVEAGHPTEDWVAGTVADCNIFEPGSRLRRPLTQDVYLSRVVAVSGGRFALTVANSGQLARLQVGDGLGCRVPGGGMTFQMDGAVNCTVSGVTLFGGPCFGFFETSGGGNHWAQIAITYPDPPPGASTRPLLSTSADGMHSVGTRVGPQITGAFFEGMDDDGIAIHGSFQLITDTAAGQLVWIANHGVLPAPGDRVALYDKAFAPTPAVAAPAYAPTLWSVAAVAPAAKGYGPPSNVSKTMPSQVLPGATFSVLTLTGPPLPASLGFDFVLVNVDAVGAGYAIRESHIRNHRARGLLLKGADGLVQNVTLTNNSLGGIIVTPELYWEEAGYARNVTLRSNTITLTSSGVQSYGGIALGAVAPGGALATAPGHAAVAILDNVLIDAGYAPIWLNAAGNVTLRGNRLITPFHAVSPADLPSCCEPLPTQKIAIYAQSVQQLVADGNCVQPAPGSALQFLFNATADCTGTFDQAVQLC